MFLSARLGPSPGLVRKCITTKQAFIQAHTVQDHPHKTSSSKLRAVSGSVISTVAAPPPTDSNLESQSQPSSISNPSGGSASGVDAALTPTSQKIKASRQNSALLETSSDLSQQAVSDLDHSTRDLPSSTGQTPANASPDVSPSSSKPARKRQTAAAAEAGMSSRKSTKTKAPADAAVIAAVDVEAQLAVAKRKVQLAAATQRIVSQLATASVEQDSTSLSESVPARKTPVRGSRVSRRRGPKAAAAASAIQPTDTIPGNASSASISGSSISGNAAREIQPSTDGSLAANSSESTKATNRRLFRQQPKTVKQLPATPITTTLEEVRKLIKPLPAVSAMTTKEARGATLLTEENQRVFDRNIPQGAAEEGDSLAEDGSSPAGRYYSERSNRRYQYATIMKRKVMQPLPAAALAALAGPDLQDDSTSVDSPTFLPSGPRRSARSRPYVVGAGSGEASTRQSATIFVSRNKKLLLRDAKRMREGSMNESEPDPELDIRAQFELWIQQVIRPEEIPSENTSTSSSGGSSSSSTTPEFIPQQFNMFASDGSRSSLGSIDLADEPEFSSQAVLDPSAVGTQAEKEAAATADAAATAAAAVAAARRAAEAEELEEDEEVDGDGAVVDPGQSDKRGKYDPRVEGVADIVNIMLGIKLPENAFYGQRALLLADMKDEDVKASCSLWLSALGPDFAAAFIGREGTLLLRHPSQMLSLFDALTASLGLLPQQCVKFALQHPFLISWYNSDRDLEALLSKLGLILQVDRLKAVRVVMHSPKLLQLTPEFLEAKAEALSTIFPIDSDEMAALLTKRPRLLLRAPSSVALIMVTLAQTLQIPVYDVAVMLAATPSILGTSSESITARWSLLCELTDRHRPWAEQLAILSLPSLGRCLASSLAAIERLDVVFNENMTHMPSLQKFKKIISMSNTVFNTLKAEHDFSNVGRIALQEKTAGGGAIAPRRYSYRDYGTGKEGPASANSSNNKSGVSSARDSANGTGGSSSRSSNSAPNGSKLQTGTEYAPKPVKSPKLSA